MHIKTEIAQNLW